MKVKKVDRVIVRKGPEWFRMEQVGVDEVIIHKVSGGNERVCSFTRGRKGAARLLRKLHQDLFKVSYDDPMEGVVS